MTFPFGDTITVIRRAARNPVGDSDGDDASHAINGVGIDWNTTSDNTDFRESTITTATLYVPKGADIVASDKVEFPDGSTWQVIGRPMWTGVHPMTGWDSGCKVVNVREVR